MPRSASGFGWVRLHLSAPVPPQAAEDAVRAVAGLAGQPRIVLEAVGRSGTVSWRLGVDRAQQAQVVATLQPHLPGLRVEDNDTQDFPGVMAVAGRLAAPGHRAAPLNLEAVEAVARGVLAGLSAAGRHESVRLQVVLGHRFAPSRAEATAGSQQRELAAKYGQYRFGCSVRFSARTGSAERAIRLVSGVASALHGLESPGVRLVLRRTGVRSVEAASSPLLWPLELGVSEVAALLGWPVAGKADAVLPGVPSPHPRLLPAARSLASHGRVLGRSVLEPHRPVALTTADSLRHLHVLGPNGTGKSTLLAQLALQDIVAGRGVVVIDPKGDLVGDVLARMPAERRSDVVVLDPTDQAPVGIDCFAGDPELAADVLLGVFHSLYADAWGPRTSDILHASLLSLARRAALTDPGSEAAASLLMVPLLLTNPGFRRSITSRVVAADPLGLGSFWATFESFSEGERHQAIAPLMNKLRQVLLRPGLRAVFGQRSPRFTLSDVFTKRRILLVSLSEGTLGPEASQLLGSVVVGLLWQAALGRIWIAESKRHPVFFYIDEVQRFLRLGDVADALARARGLGVGFTLAHQHLGQLPPNLREAVMANARSKIAFQLGTSDAKTYAALSSGQLQPIDFETLPAFQAYAGLLAGNAPAPWCSLLTDPLPDVPNRASYLAAARAESAHRYGRPLSEIEQELADLAQGSTARSRAEGVVGRHRPGAPS